MTHKKLFNKLHCVASVLIENESICCDFTITSNRIFLHNWRNSMVSQVALKIIYEICVSYELHFYVNFKLQKVTIYV